jgi:phosphatidylinositol-3-phosphatase
MLIPLLLTLAAIGCGTSVASGDIPTISVRALPASRTSHVAIIVMENKDETDVVGRKASPYVNSLVRRYGLATQSFAVSHPSLPNYLALTSGSTHGIRSDCTACTVPGPNIGDQLNTARVTWKAYMQSYPRSSGCVNGDHGRYAQRHNPFVYYRHDPAVCSHLVGFPSLISDLKRGSLPTFVWISPNTCSDTHDCGVGTGDAFLHAIVPALLHEIGPHGYIVITWDEGNSNAGYGPSRGGHIATLVAGPTVRPGARLATRINHYGVLASLERSLGLPLLGAAGRADSGSLTPMFTSAPSAP